MTLFEPGRPGDLKTNYGYLGSGEDIGLDPLENRWGRYTTPGWNRPFELVLKKPQPYQDGLPPEKVKEFHVVCRESFRYIGQRHNISPKQLWMRIEAGLEVMNMHRDDIDSIEQFLAGWIDFSSEELERLRWRYPKRCPVLDVLCSLDDTCERLNSFQDWVLQMNGMKGRRRNELLPPLPDPDGVRPVGVPSSRT